MNAEERNLIAGLFERLRGSETAYRDPEADAFIREQVAAQPHAPYAMAQTVIVQNQALEASQARVAELERQLEAPRGAAPAESAPWGPRANAAMGAPASFGASAPAFGGGAQPGAHAAPPIGQHAGAQQPAGRGGGFMSGALQTAAGVAGGALLFTGIQSMLGGGQAAAATPEADKAAEAEPAAEPTEVADASGGDGGGEGGGWFSGLFGGGSQQTADAGPADDGGDDEWV